MLQYVYNPNLKGLFKYGQHLAFKTISLDSWKHKTP
jgi:hypothetical protein